MKTPFKVKSLVTVTLATTNLIKDKIYTVIKVVRINNTLLYHLEGQKVSGWYSHRFTKLDVDYNKIP